MIMKRNILEKVIVGSQFSKQLLRVWLRKLDPTVVRFRNPRRFPRWVMGAGIAGGFLLVCFAAVAAAIPKPEIDAHSNGTDDNPQDVEKHSTFETVQPKGFAESVSKPKPKNSEDIEPEEQIEPQLKKSEFYDPVYVFFEGDVQNVTAYPLASPAGIVVDLHGTPEPALEASELVGQDPRIRSLKRRVTTSGIRYIIGLSTPIERVEIFTEGNVAMVFPVS